MGVVVPEEECVRESGEVGDVWCVSSGTGTCGGNIRVCNVNVLFVYPDSCSLELHVIIRGHLCKCVCCSVRERYVFVYECDEAAAFGSLSVSPKSCVTRNLWCLVCVPKLRFLYDGYVYVMCVECVFELTNSHY